MCTSSAEQAVVNYYLNDSLKGGAYVESHIFQKGSGIGSVLSSIGRLALPALKKLGGYAVKAVGKFAGDTASDIISGRNVGQALRGNASAAIENGKFDMSQKLNMKRVAKKNKSSTSKKRRKNPRTALW
jgi:hypothetical protein